VAAADDRQESDPIEEAKRIAKRLTLELEEENYDRAERMAMLFHVLGIEAQSFAVPVVTRTNEALEYGVMIRESEFPALLDMIRKMFN
jgi:hypothetical protein